jgi:hypothetical protein
MSESPPLSTLNFKAKQLNVTNVIQTLYENETEKPAIVVTGTFSNISEDIDQTHYINLKLVNGSVSSWIFYNIPLVFGSTLLIPKLTVNPEGILQVSVSNSSSSGLVDAALSVLEI